jgi:predicted N-acetyltransferase YhbS
MCSIRPATPADIDGLLALVEPFFAFSQFSRFVSCSADTARPFVEQVVDTGIAFVADEDGAIVGGIIGLMSPIWFNPSAFTAAELGWWVSESHRGGMAGVKLLRAFENEAKERGAVVVTMSDLSAGGEWPAGKLFEKLGYAVVERCQMKGF